MHTGYDNFWMHKNSRLKPVLNLPKNDNYSCALLTDSYKHMQSGGCPSHLSSFTLPQNNAGSNHEKDHYRNGHDQSLWPSSVYSLPFMPSHANNFYPQEPFFSHTNNFVYLSPNPQTQGKHDIRHLEMSNGNVNILTMHNTNTNNLANNGLAQAQNNKNTNPKIPRIRVKDVFSLNNKSSQGHLGLDGHFGIRQQKELPMCATHCNTALQSQTQTEYMKYKNANLLESSKSSHFERRTAKQTCLNNQQDKFQNSCSFYQQTEGFSLGNFEFNGGRQIESSLSSESFQSSTPASLLSQLLTQESILERGLQNCQGNTDEQGNAQGEHEGQNVTPLRNSTELHDTDYSGSDYSRSCRLNERTPENGTNLRNFTNVHCDLHENLPKINEVNLKIRNSGCNIMAKNAPSITSKSPPLKDINNHQNSFIKISIPHTGKSTFIKLNDRDETEKNSAVSLLSFEHIDKNCAIDRNTHSINDEESGVVNSIPPPVGQGSFINLHASPLASSMCDSSANEDGVITNKTNVPAISTSLPPPPRNRQEDTINQLHQQGSDALSNKDGDFFQNSTGAPEIIQHKLPGKISRGDDGTAEQGILTNDLSATSLTLKQECFHPEIESPSLKPAQNPPEDEEFHPTIKTEENSENLTARECELGLHPPDVVNEALPKCHIEGCGSANKSASVSAPVTNTEDHVDKVNSLKSSSSKTGDVQKPESTMGEGEVSSSRVNYKSNINRDKLDMLIRFLKRDQDSSGSTSWKQGQSCRETASNANSDSCRSRRKLNKASIVRNKNNSREMISLMSLKGSNFTCNAPQIAKRSKNLEETEDRNGSCLKDSVMAAESIDVAKERMKCNNTCQKNESKKGDSWTIEPSNEVACLSKQQVQESSEKPVPKDKCAGRGETAIISTVRAFQNYKTHFCVSCNLVLSIESFWINVISGEVRCLNCFKRTTLKAKTKRNVLKSKSNDLHDSSLKALRERKSKTEKENKTKDSAAVDSRNFWDEGGRKRSSKCEGDLRKLNGMKEHIRQEVLEIFISAKRKSNERKETANCPCRKRRGSSGEGVDSQKGKPSNEKVLKTEKPALDGSSSIKEVKTSTSKEQYSEDGAKEESLIKSDKSHGRRSSRSEERSENRGKKETKEGASGNTCRSSDDAGEEFRCHKVSLIEERGQKDTKVRHCTDESRKPLLGEGFPARKDHAAEEAAKRRARQETADKSKNQNIRREGGDHQRPKTSKPFGREDPNAPDASARRTSNENGVQNEKRMESTEQPRKRKNSGEDFSPRKVHISEDFTKRCSGRATHPSKSSEAKASKRDDNSQRTNSWKASTSSKESGRSDASKEECVLFGEHLRKETKPPPEREKERAKDLWKGVVASRRAKPSEPAKGREIGFVKHLRKKSKEEQRGARKAVGSRRASDEAHIGGEGKRENLSAENREKRKSEEKEGSRSSEKMPKVSSRGPDVLATPAKDGRPRRPDDASRLFGEKQSSKTTTGAPRGN